MRDYYLDFNNFTNRLREELKKYGKLIVAYDFDDTVNDFHNKGRKYNDIISLLQRLKKLDIATFICYTCSNEERYPYIHNCLDTKEIPCDMINGQPSTGLDLPKGKKLYYNVLLDDRAGLQMAYNALNTICSEIENKEDII